MILLSSFLSLNTTRSHSCKKRKRNGVGSHSMRVFGQLNISIFNFSPLTCGRRSSTIVDSFIPRHPCSHQPTTAFLCFSNFTAVLCPRPRSYLSLFFHGRKKFQDFLAFNYELKWAHGIFSKNCVWDISDKNTLSWEKKKKSHGALCLCFHLFKHTLLCFKPKKKNSKRIVFRDFQTN